MSGNPNRDTLGRLVREAWVEWAREQPDPKPSWLAPWEELSEPDREADRRIGEAVYAHAVREVQPPSDRPAGTYGAIHPEDPGVGLHGPLSDSPAYARRLVAAIERANETNAKAPPWFLVEDSDGAPLPQEAQDVIWRLTETIRLTQEYIDLPAVPGWSWYDALAQYRPELFEKGAPEQDNDGAAPASGPNPW